MLSISLFFLFFTLAGQITFSDQIIINSNFYSEADILYNKLFIDGIIAFNTKNNFYLNSTGSIVFINLPQKSAEMLLALNSNNKLCYQNTQAINYMPNDINAYNSLYTNNIFPFLIGGTILNINTETKNETHIGTMTINNPSHIAFNAKEIFLNASLPISSSLLRDTISFSPDLTIKGSFDSNNITLDNINKENKIIGSDIMFEKLDTEYDITIFNDDKLTATITSLSAPNNTINSNATKISLINFEIPLLRNLTNSIFFIIVDENNIVSKSSQPLNLKADSIVTSNLSPKISDPETTGNITIETNNITSLDCLVGQYAFSVAIPGTTTINYINTGTITINMENNTNFLGPVQCKKIDTRFTKTNPLNVERATTITGFEIQGTLNLPQKTIFQNIPLSANKPTNSRLIVTNQSQQWIWGLPPIQSLKNIEYDRLFSLSKEDFLKSLVPIFVETEDKKEFTTLSLSELEHSEHCSLIIEYDKNKEPVYYDTQGILAIALTQLPLIKEEITLLDAQGKEIENMHNELNLSEIHTYIIDLIKEIQKQTN
jgi:hypothetical protein